MEALSDGRAPGVRGRWVFFFSSRRRHTRLQGDWSSDVCSSDLSSWRLPRPAGARAPRLPVARLRGRLQPQRNCGACAGAAWYGQGLGSTRTACPERVHAMSGDTHPNPSGSTDDGSPDDLQMQAGEYVLGTLNAAQRRSIESRLPYEPALRTAVQAWEQRLLPLHGRAQRRLV